MSYPKYAIVTPARNEESHIARLIESVARQTVLPHIHVVVSDGSTDHTESMVKRYMKDLSYLNLMTRTHDQIQGFGSKALAFNMGWNKVRTHNPDFIVNLDADVALDSSYFNEILSCFTREPELGLAGGWIYEQQGQSWQPQKIQDDSVAGPVQCFRSACLDAICGYYPLKSGGIDTLAEIMVRRLGWQTRTIRSLVVKAYRPVRTGQSSCLGVRFNKGMVQYRLGYHPFYQLVSCIYRLPEKPVCFGSLATLLGYIKAACSGEDYEIPREFLDYVRDEQIQRMVNIFLKSR